MKHAYILARLDLTPLTQPFPHFLEEFLKFFIKNYTRPMLVFPVFCLIMTCRRAKNVGLFQNNLMTVLTLTFYFGSFSQVCGIGSKSCLLIAFMTNAFRNCIVERSNRSGSTASTQQVVASFKHRLRFVIN